MVSGARDLPGRRSAASERVGVAATTGARSAWRDVLLAVVVSRVLVAVTAAIAATALSVNTGYQTPAGKVVPGVSHPFGDGWLAGVADALLTPLVRWDALWYLTISHHGYQPDGLVPGNPGERAAFFPLYPLLVHLLGGFAGDGATLVVATLLSLAAFTGALLVVHRLASLEAGPAVARATVLIIAFWPGPFFSAPYTESLFLLLTAGAFLAARQDRWILACALAGLASATRNTGLLLALPLLLLYLYGPRGRDAWPPARAGRPRWAPRNPVGADVLWIALVPVGLIAYCVYLQIEVGDWQAWRHAQESFGRPGFASPLTTLKDALVGVKDTVRNGLGGLGGPSLLDVAAFGIVVAAVVGLARRLPIAYAAWVAVAIAPALVSPFAGEALRSVPRFTGVLFPVAIWLAIVLTRRRLLAPALALSAVLLVVTTAAFVSWAPYV